MSGGGHGAAVRYRSCGTNVIHAQNSGTYAESLSLNRGYCRYDAEKNRYVVQLDGTSARTMPITPGSTLKAQWRGHIAGSYPVYAQILVYQPI